MNTAGVLVVTEKNMIEKTTHVCGNEILFSHFGIRNSDFGFMTSGLCLRTSGFSLLISHFRLRTSGFGLRTPFYQAPSTQHPVNNITQTI
jgi:hypothetical protein